jgi:hypothetical protein
MPGISKRSRGFEGTKPSDLGGLLKNEDLAELIFDWLGVKFSRREMQDSFEDFQAFLGAVTAAEAANLGIEVDDALAIAEQVEV